MEESKENVENMVGGTANIAPQTSPEQPTMVTTTPAPAAPTPTPVVTPVADPTTPEPAKETSDVPQMISSEEVKEEAPTKEKKPMNLKLILICAGAALLVIVMIVVVLFVLPNKKEESKTQQKVQDKTTESAFVRVVKESIESGEFIKEINKGLEINGLSAESVSLLSLDIDSDNEQEIIVYVEDAVKKYILQLEVDERVFYEDSFQVDSKDSLGFAYSAEKNLNYWYTEFEKNFTIIASAKKVIKEEDFLKNLFPLTKTYDEKPILTTAIEYKMDKNLDVSRLEFRSISNKGLLDNNQMKSEDIRAAYDKYLKAKEEEEAKKKEEEEQKAKEEEEAKKLAGSLQLGTSSYKYGTYNVYAKDGSIDGTLVIYGDLTCVHKGIECSYTVGEVRGEKDAVVTGITLSTGQIYIPSSVAGELTDREGSVSIRFAS